MAGVAFIFPWLKGFWPQDVKFRKFRDPLKWIWETAALSISCQITTGPLAYVYFGTFPVHFLLTNLIAMPLTGLIIPAAVLTVMLTAAGWCPEMLLRATEALVTALSEALNIIASM
jgi:competence protein ComEC